LAILALQRQQMSAPPFGDDSRAFRSDNLSRRQNYVA
jgi:hypothetical protein